MSGPRTAMAEPPHAVRAIGALLETGRIAHAWHYHPAVRTIAEALATVPHLTAGLLKTVVFARDGTDVRALVAVPCRAQVDYAALARALVCSRRDLRLVPPARIEAELGFEVGGVGPFALTEACVVLLDDSIPADARVLVGGGAPGYTLELCCGDLLRLPRARRAALARPVAETPA